MCSRNPWYVNSKCVCVLSPYIYDLVDKVIAGTYAWQSVEWIGEEGAKGKLETGHTETRRASIMTIWL